MPTFICECTRHSFVDVGFEVLSCVANHCACENGGYCDQRASNGGGINTDDVCVCPNEYTGRLCQIEKGA